METLLSEWIYALRDKHNRVSRKMIQKKAMEIYPTVSDGSKAFHLLTTLARLSALKGF